MKISQHKTIPPRFDDGPPHLSHTSHLLPAFRRQGSIQGRKSLPQVPDMETQVRIWLQVEN